MLPTDRAPCQTTSERNGQFRPGRTVWPRDRRRVAGQTSDLLRDNGSVARWPRRRMARWPSVAPTEDSSAVTKILLICGSTREGSTNGAALSTVASTAPDGVTTV